MATIRIEEHNRDTVCRICNKNIPKKTECYALRPLNIGGFWGPAFFHEDCMNAELDEAGRARR